MRKILAALVLIGWAGSAAADGDWFEKNWGGEDTAKRAWATFEKLDSSPGEWNSSLTFKAHQRCDAIAYAAYICKSAQYPWGTAIESKAANRDSGETWVFDCNKLRAHFDHLEPRECFRRHR